jgi:hypothetical protein
MSSATNHTPRYAYMPDTQEDLASARYITASGLMAITSMGEFGSFVAPYDYVPRRLDMDQSAPKHQHTEIRMV